MDHLVGHHRKPDSGTDCPVCSVSGRTQIGQVTQDSRKNFDYTRSSTSDHFLLVEAWEGYAVCQATARLVSQL